VAHVSVVVTSAGWREERRHRKTKKEGRGLFKGTVHPKMKPLIIYCSKLV